MTNKTYISIIGFMIFLAFNSVNAQVIVTKNDTIGVNDNSVFLKLDKYIGDIQWENSEDGVNWVEVLNEKKDSISISTDINSFYRAKVTVNNCSSFYSDTTQFRKGEIAPLKSEVFPQEICYLKLDNIKQIDSVYYADFNGTKIKLLLVNTNHLMFLMPELNVSSGKMNLSVNNQTYLINFNINKLPLIENPAKYYSDLVDSTQMFIDNFKSNINSLTSEMSDVFKEGDFDSFTHYFDSLLIDLRNNTSELSEKDLKFISGFLSANPGFFNYPNYSPTESSLKSGNIADYIPEKQMQNIAKNIFFNANQLDLIANNLGTSETSSYSTDDIKQDIIEKVIEELYENAKEVEDKIKSIFDVYGNSMAVLRITETINMVRNKVYIQDGLLVPLNIEDLNFKSNISSSLLFTSSYRNLIIDDQIKYVALKAALEDFNEAYIAALSTPFISKIDFIAESFGIINIGAQFPLNCRISPSVYKVFTVKPEYIVSQEADIKSSISNSNVKLTGFSKNIDGPLNLQFENLTDLKQYFSLNVNYEHKTYSKSTTTLSATVLPPKYKLGYSNPFIGPITDAEIKFANPESKSFILLNEDGTTATGIDYSQISIANNTNSNVIIGLLPILGTNGSFFLELKTNQSTKQYSSFDVLYKLKKMQMLNVSVGDSTEIYKAAVVGKWTVSIIDYPDNPPYDVEFYADGNGKYLGAGGVPFTNGGYGIRWYITKLNNKYYLYESGFWHPGFNQFRKIGNNMPNESLTYPITFFKTYGDLGTGLSESLTYTKQ